MSYDVYGVGNAIMDLQLQCDDDFLKTIGVKKGLMTLVDETAQMRVIDVLRDHTIYQCSGGSACNTIVGISDFGGKTAYACKIGNDQFGRRYTKELNDLGIASKVAPTSGHTGTCVVLITPDAQRTMLTHLGVSSQLSADDIDAKEIAKAKYIYIEGYLFTGDETRAAAYRAMKIAKELGVKVAFTVSDPFLIQAFRNEFWEIIRSHVDLLFCNLDEARALTGLHGAIECAKDIHEHASNIALTLGKEGSIIMNGGKLHPISAIEVKAIDTTGAGDMYAAGVLYGITNGLNWQQAGRLGSHASSRVVSQMGARMKQRFSPEEIQQLIS
ncbi:MAG: adenosine kinase [Mariprofundales bacterium]